MHTHALEARWESLKASITVEEEEEFSEDGSGMYDSTDLDEEESSEGWNLLHLKARRSKCVQRVRHACAAELRRAQTFKACTLTQARAGEHQLAIQARILRLSMPVALDRFGLAGRRMPAGRQPRRRSELAKAGVL